MRKILPVLLLFCFIGSQAHALTLPENAMYYTNPKYPMWVGTFTFLSNGDMVLSGCIRHSGEYRDMPEENFVTYESKEGEILVDAAVVCLKPDGTKRWSLRLGDPQAVNFFWCLGQMPDERLLFAFQANDSASFGSQHFIVGLDGIVEEMLPVRKLAEIVPPRAIELLPSGYFHWGGIPIDEVFGEDYPREMVMLDFDFNEIWRKPGAEDYNYSVVEKPDGYYCYGGKTQEETYNSYTFALSVLKLDKEGNKVWEFTEEPVVCLTFAECLMFPEDGGLAFIGTYRPERTPENADRDVFPYTLTKLNADGTHQWSKVYEDVSLYDAAVWGDGYVLAAKLNPLNMDHHYMLLRVDKNGEVLGKMLIDGEDGDEMVPVNPSFATDAEGNVYVYAHLAGQDDPVTLYSGEVNSFFYAKLDESSFQ